MITKELKAKIIKDFTGDSKNSGSTIAQIALLTYDIESLKKHFEKNKKDLHSKRGFFAKIEKRKKLIKYLKLQDFKLYKETIEKLNIRK